ncbi:hypothetical protein KL951_004228 [Ogataea haglerorum]|nr:hypothetical protein KL951_004228 [Ogataea haglerorum]KAG7799605.1 hypothetical protein KL944_004203 [Ogataea haglerorum]
MDDFQVLELIGRGSFGCVRKVRRISDGKVFVRKEISYGAMNSKEKHQLSTEFRILRELRHPNIVQYLHHDHVQDEHQVHLYMEYCDGGDLSVLIKKYKERNEFIPETLIWQIFTQVLNALYKCHYGTSIEPVSDLFQSSPELEPKPVDHQVIIHRDIKPDNIFLLSDGYSIKLGDFGLAKWLQHENEFAKTYVGTPYYMSPEVLMDRPYDPVCDVWSLGCVMYELCALRPPFQAKTHLALQEKIKAGTFQPIPDHYSHRLQMVINACLIVDPMERATVNQLLQDASFKVFRKEWELTQWENRLREHETELLLRERKLVKFEDALNEECKNMNVKFEEIRNGYKNEFNYMLGLQLNKVLTELFGNQLSPTLRQQLANRVGKENYQQPAFQNHKLKGPRELYDRAQKRDEKRR